MAANRWAVARMVHAAMCDNWGYERLHKAIGKRAIEEMKHPETLIERVIFLEGKPIVSALKPLHVGPEVETQHKNDWAAEDGAIKAYNEDIRLAVEVGDNGTREILEATLRDEEDHI